MENVRQFIIDRNLEQSAVFSSPDARLARKRYRAIHPTEIAALKCMDGRLNLAVMTETPPGIIQPFRNIGGRFDLGWPFFGETIRGWVEYGVGNGRRCLVFVTYHFSRGDRSRGCAGFKYDTEAAFDSALALRRQFEAVFGTGHTVVYPIVVGIETDNEALIFHGLSQGHVDMSDVPDMSNGVESLFKRLYPGMDSSMLNDLLALARGNQHHIKEIKRKHRAPIELEHREQIIAVGRGFDWLHLPNRALIIGPYSHTWPDAVDTAATIIRGNIEAERVSAKADVLLLVSALSREREGSPAWNVAVEKAKYLARVAKEVIDAKHPDVAKRLSHLVGVVDADTRLLHHLESST